jgi:hypothetical protein
MKAESIFLINFFLFFCYSLLFFKVGSIRVRRTSSTHARSEVFPTEALSIQFGPPGLATRRIWLAFL